MLSVLTRTRSTQLLQFLLSKQKEILPQDARYEGKLQHYHRTTRKITRKFTNPFTLLLSRQAFMPTAITRLHVLSNRKALTPKYVIYYEPHRSHSSFRGCPRIVRILVEP
jgi:hypothetical protein